MICKNIFKLYLKGNELIMQERQWSEMFKDYQY